MLQPLESGDLDSLANRTSDAFVDACREAELFANRLAAQSWETPSPDMLALAKQVVREQEAQDNEDVQTWADRLANDVGNDGR